MRLHLTGAFEYQDVRVGFGNAAWHIVQQFQSAGFDVSVSVPDDAAQYDADVEMCFDHGGKYRFVCPNAYRIGYTPWESTEIPPSWRGPMQSCDELWAPNDFCVNVFKHHFPDKPVFKYQHGISEQYVPKKRRLRDDKPFTFLFIGEPQVRKDGQMVVDTFVELFENNPDYRLIVKGTHDNRIVVEGKDTPITASPDFIHENVIVITKMYDPAQMLQLYDEADVFVYPSWGEGWGFNPIQALALGIPTISTSAWSDYAEYITVPIDSYPAISPWQEIHPGMMFRPDRSQLRQAMMSIRDHYDSLSAQTFKNSFEIHKNFSWEKVSEEPIARLKKIFSTLNFNALA